ncbi:MAG: FAD-binding oxidoreductase [Steroidobacteraceae bacterium]
MRRQALRTEFGMLGALTRRQLLRLIAAGGAALARPAWPQGSDRPRLGGRIVLRNDADYETWRASMVWHWSKPQRFPEAIVQARSVDDVQAAVRYAARNARQVSLRSSGHNGSCVSLRDRAVLIDTSALRRVQMAADGDSAWVGPGTTSRELLDALAKAGRIFPAAHCATVAMGGYVLGGGMGWNGDQFGGMACHNLLGARIVTAEGEKLEVDEQRHPDWMYALRGAGSGMFAAVSELRLRTFAAPAVIGNAMLVYPSAEAPGVVRRLRERALSGPANTEAVMLLLHAPTKGEAMAADRFVCVVQLFAYAADESQARSALQHYTGSSLRRGASMVVDYQSTSIARMYSPQNTELDYGRYAVDNFWSDDPEAAVQVFLARLATVPAPRGHVLYTVKRNTDLQGNACLSRMANDYFACYLVWDHLRDDADNRRWLRETMKKLQPHTTGRYINEIDELAQSERVTDCYSPEAWRRLRELRKRYDPQERFCDYLGLSA